MEGHLFYQHSPWLVFLVTSLALFAAGWIGFLIGRRGSRQVDDTSQIGGIQTSVLGLLALLLGFTFGVASSRYDARRVLAIDEANALGTTFLRAQTLPDPYAARLSEMLRQYVEVRLRMVSETEDPSAIHKMRPETERLQRMIWGQAALVAKEYPSDITGLFLESMNQSIDLYSSRVATYEARVPNAIMWILALISLASVGLVGYGFGLVGQRSWGMIGLTCALIAATIVMIVDLDRPESGPTRVSQQSMIDLRNSISAYEKHSEGEGCLHE